MKKLVILVVILILLGGGAVGAMVVFGIGPFAKPKIVEPVAAPVVKNAYIDMEAISIPVFIPDQKPRQVYMTLRLESKEEFRSKISHMMPRIRDALITNLQIVLPVHLKNRPTTDLAQLKPRMLSDIAKVMGPGVVSDVLVVEIFER
ncbi:exported hypothetical protein [Rhodospirillaceae bacterium LM-1]|nr:exported hypothetical protein [Rhodospirillaceae bacterium LM-1]